MKQKLIATLLAVGILASAAPMAFAEEDVTATPIAAEIPVQEAGIGFGAPKIQPAFGRFDVKVLEKGEYLHTQAIDAEGEEGIYDIVINEDTLIYDTNGNKLTPEDIDKDTELQFSFKANKPMIMIYPPRYTPEVVIVKAEAEEGKLPANVWVDNYKKSDFENQLVSSDNFLRFEPTAELDVVDTEGNNFEGDLEGRDLIVFYTIATMSIPALTNPEKIIVMDEEKAEDVEAAVAVTKVAVNGGDAVELNLSDEAEGMLPVRQVAELMDLEVRWDDVVNAVAVGTIPMGVNFNVGVNSYNKARMTPFVLSAAPVQVVEGDYAVTYVPQDFFTEVLNAELTVDGDTLVITME